MILSSLMGDNLMEETQSVGLTDKEPLSKSARKPTYDGIPGVLEKDDLEKKEDSSVRAMFKEMSWRKRLTAITAAMVNFSSLACFAIMAPFLPREADEKS